MSFNFLDGGEFILKYISEFSFTPLNLKFTYLYAEHKINTSTERVRKKSYISNFRVI
jgi:hypothetical protein